MTRGPGEFSPALLEAVTELAQADRLLVALDFDGTLSPLVDRPYEARVLPESARAIAELEILPATWVAYISGRSLDGLKRVIPADDLAFLVGSHGVEVQYGPHGGSLELKDDERATLAQLGAALQSVVDGFEGAHLETKPVGFGVHTRGLPAAEAKKVNDAAYRAVEKVPGRFTVRDGKGILEFSVREATKGDAIQRMRAHVSATAVFFAGDDVTDEDGFVVLREGDVGVKVGEGPTAAEYRVGDPHEFARLLTLLAVARSRRDARASRGA
jgi:trehalose 6-phosphate phosphatase